MIGLRLTGAFFHPSPQLQLSSDYPPLPSRTQERMTTMKRVPGHADRGASLSEIFTIATAADNTWGG